MLKELQKQNLKAIKSQSIRFFKSWDWAKPIYYDSIYHNAIDENDVKKKKKI